MLPIAVFGAWIAIAISGPTPSREERDELLRACSEAIAGRCTLANDGQKLAGSPDALAVLTLDSKTSHARVELGRAGSDWKRRDLSFAKEDSKKERWRALGLTLATLFGGPAPSSETATPEPQEATPRPPPEDAMANTASSRAGRDEAGVAVRLGAGLFTSPALAEGPLRWGARVRGSVGPFLGIVEPSVALGYGFRPGSSRGLHARFFCVSAGLAVTYAPAEVLVLRPRLEAAGEWISVSQTSPADSGDRFVAGTLFGLEAAWPARSRVSVFASAELWVFTGATAIRAGGEDIGTVPSRRWVTTAGILLELD